MSKDRKVSLITGGGQGIGKAVARRFLRGGMRVFIAEIDEEAGQETEKELAALGEIRFMRTDVSDEGMVKNAVEDCVQRFGRIDSLVNNAGSFLGMGTPLTELGLDDWNRVLSVNLTGAFLCTKHCAPHLAERRGAVINIASTRAYMSEKDTFAYSASKGGLVSLTHCLAISLGPLIRVNCISPGWIDVTSLRKSAARTDSGLTLGDHSQHPAGRVGTPEDIASLAAFLVSPEASFITGASMIADGGMTRKMIYI